MKLIKICQKSHSAIISLLLVILISGCTERIDIYENINNENYNVEYDFLSLINKKCIKINNSEYRIVSADSMCDLINAYNLNGLVKIYLDRQKILEGYLYYESSSILNSMSFFSIHKGSVFKLLCYDKQRLREVNYGNQFIDCKLYKTTSENKGVNNTLLLQEQNVVLRFRITRE